MFEGLFGLHRYQKIYLHAAMLAPSIMVLLLLFPTNDALLTLGLFQLVCYVLIPTVYIRLLSKEREMGVYFLNELRNKLEQFTKGFWGFLGAVGILFSMYFFFIEFRYSFLISLKIPVQTDLPYLFALGVLFIIVHPVLEELFWRLFMLKTFKDTEFNKSLVIFHYALYHWVVLVYIAEWKTATLMVFSYFSLGKSLEYIKCKFGIISSIVTHFGCSLGLGLIFLDILYTQSANRNEAVEFNFPAHVPLIHNHAM